jgi:hypothetical protein
MSPSPAKEGIMATRNSKAPLSQPAPESIAPDLSEAAQELPGLLQDEGDVEELLILLEKVDRIAAEVGGLDRLRSCLEALQKIAEGEAA